MRGTEKIKNSVRVYTKRFLLILVPLILIYSGISVVSAVYFRRQIENYAESFINFYMNQIDTTISNINYRTSMFVLSANDTGENLETYMSTIKTTSNKALRDYYSGRLRDVFLMYSVEYGRDYQFFAFLPEKHLFIGSNSSNTMQQEEWEDCRDDIVNKLGEQELTPNSGSQYWQFVKGSGGEDYILKLYYIDRVYVGCWIRPDDLIEPLKSAFEDERNSVCLYDSADHLISGKSTALSGRILFQKRFRTMPFRIEMAIHDYGLFQKTFLLNLFLSFIALGIFATILFSIYTLYRKIMKPIKKFSDNLEQMNKKQIQMEEITPNELFELEQANDKFRQLLQKIYTLQNKIYEDEIKKQMMHMEYLKLQIKPHFYLNCLNFIYNMIDLKQYPQAAQMSLMTAEYMRYLFNDDRNLVCIWEELEHIEHYLKIQKLRFEKAFEYYMEQEEETKNVRIPPLTIQTFAENCIKYAMSFEEKLQITITVFAEHTEKGDYVNICVMDNGPGFPEEILDKLKAPKDQIDLGSGHIGISNTLKRLYYTYRGNAAADFYNGPGRGAVTEIHIPFELPGADGRKVE